MRALLFTRSPTTEARLVTWSNTPAFRAFAADRLAAIATPSMQVAADPAANGVPWQEKHNEWCPGIILSMLLLQPGTSFAHFISASLSRGACGLRLLRAAALARPPDCDGHVVRSPDATDGRWVC